MNVKELKKIFESLGIRISPHADHFDIKKLPEELRSDLILACTQIKKDLFSIPTPY